MLYFSYGSNMSKKRIVDRVPSATVVGVAMLKSHELRFHKVSKKDGSAKCDILKTVTPDKQVVGVVFDIDEKEKDALDRKEGLCYGYEQKNVEVVTAEGEKIKVFTYIATNTDEKLKPYHWYKEHVIRGAKENNLPEQYIKIIENIESIADPDKARHNKEMEIYREQDA